jgi:hypothetical protein
MISLKLHEELEEGGSWNSGSVWKEVRRKMRDEKGFLSSLWQDAFPLDTQTMLERMKVFLV